MKLVKLTMLAATAAIAAMAFIGASSASAIVHPWIGWCDAKFLLLCPKEHQLAHPLKIRAFLLAGKGKFNAGFVNVECESGKGETKELEASESEQKENFTGTLVSLKFETCKGCTGVEVKTPQVTTLNMENETEAVDWRLKAEKARVKFTGCPLGATCTYEGTLNLKVQMDEEGAFVDPEGVAFNLVEGSFGCAEKGKWESGRSRLDILLDDKVLSVHKNVYPFLEETLLVIAAREL